MCILSGVLLTNTGDVTVSTRDSVHDSLPLVNFTGSFGRVGQGHEISETCHDLDGVKNPKSQHHVRTTNICSMRI